MFKNKITTPFTRWNMYGAACIGLMWIVTVLCTMDRPRKLSVAEELELRMRPKRRPRATSFFDADIQRLYEHEVSRPMRLNRTHLHVGPEFAGNDDGLQNLG